jgi:S-DNA-T family DNA segregation ATPase FtsK/SpoIIIE
MVQEGSGGGAVGWVLAETLWKALRVDSSQGATIGRVVSAAIWGGVFLLSAFYAARPLLTTADERRVTNDEWGEDEPLVVTGIGKSRTAKPIGKAEDKQTIKGIQLPLPNTPAVENKKKGETAKSVVPEVEFYGKPKGAINEIKSQAKIVKDDKKPETRSKKYVPRPNTLPPLDLLKRAKETKTSDADVQRQADVIEQTLAHFGLAGKVTEIRRGPTVTQFGIEPGYVERGVGADGEKKQQKVRVGQIAALQNDFALALAAPSIRIEAPIPGRSLVGIEVPNTSIGLVDVRSLMEGEAFRAIAEKSSLAIVLGRDVSGAPICADLGRMPHLLIAGTTGSGKSVCISAITTALVVNNRPEDLKLVMIDPKMVELSRFAGLPHVIGKPEHDMERIPGVLRWVVNEMDRRYKKFAELGSRNLSDYNNTMAKREEEPLPRMVVLIDELADLMMNSPIETEKQLCRLAQMARATGIHLVVATQRPSVDVVTGLIKANFPARISFAVASAMDSRVILDQVGAESLLGKGDMLWVNPETGAPLRMQGCFVSDAEVEKVIKWWSKQVESENPKAERKEEEYVANKKPESDTPWETVVAEIASERAMASSGKAGGGNGDGDSDDDLIEKAMEIIRNNPSVSTSLLQRKLRIGYPRAARLMEELQEMGYVGGKSGQAGKARDVKMRDED